MVVFGRGLAFITIRLLSMFSRQFLPLLMVTVFAFLTVLPIDATDATTKPGQRGTDRGLLEVPVEGEELSKRDWLRLPVPSKNPSTGFGLAATGAYIYLIDEESQASMSGLGAYGSAAWLCAGVRQYIYWPAIPVHDIRDDHPVFGIGARADCP